MFTHLRGWEYIVRDPVHELKVSHFQIQAQRHTVLGFSISRFILFGTKKFQMAFIFVFFSF